MTPAHLTLAAVAALAAAGAVQKRGSRSVTRSDAFRRWFGDSKVVDQDGDPLRVYHGTHGDFESFQNPYTDPKHAPGAWSMFSTDPKYSDEFAWGRGGSMLAVYLKIEKPLDLTVKGEEVTIGEMRAMLEDAGIDISRISYFSKYRHPRSKSRVFQYINEMTRQLAREMRRLGYDGIKMPDAIYSAEEGVGYIRATTWIILEPTQVKSATGNRGTFDPEDPRISYNRREP